MADLDALAAKYGGTAAAAPDNIDALAAKFGGKAQPAPTSGIGSQYDGTMYDEGMLDPQQGSNITGGLIRGAGSIGATLVAPYDIIKDAINGKGLSLDSNNQRRKDIEAGLTNLIGSDPNSGSYQAAKLASEVAGTAGVGSVAGNALRAVPIVQKIAPALPTAIETAGMRTGVPAATSLGQAWINGGTRILGGAVNGGLTAGLVDPSAAPSGAILGGSLPIVSKVAGEVGKGVKSTFIDPIINQDQLVSRAIGRAVGADNAPTVISSLYNTPATQGVKFSVGQASGSPALAAMEDSLRTVNPGGLLVAQDQANRGVLANSLRGIAQDDAAMTAAKLARSDAAEPLYTQAWGELNPSTLTPEVNSQISSLLQRPAMQQAMSDANVLAKNMGMELSDNTSIQGLHFAKQALDDQISAAVRAGNGNTVRALMDTKDKLLGVLEKISPTYGQGMAKYAELSRPINQMEIGQFLANKLIPSTAGDVPQSLNAASLATSLRNPDAAAKTATGFSGATLERTLTPEQLSLVNGVNLDASRIAETYKLGAGQGSPTARRLAVTNFIGDNIAQQSPVLSSIFGTLGNVPGINYVTKGVGAMGNMIGGKLNANMADKLETMLATNPDAVKEALIMAQRRAAGLLSEPTLNPVLRSGLLASPVVQSGQR